MKKLLFILLLSLIGCDAWVEDDGVAGRITEKKLYDSPSAKYKYIYVIKTSSYAQFKFFSDKEYELNSTMTFVTTKEPEKWQ